MEHTYTYGDANWKDLLTAFDGHSITYDGGGNPLSYYNGRAYTPELAQRTGAGQRHSGRKNLSL